MFIYYQKTVSRPQLTHMSRYILDDNSNNEKKSCEPGGLDCQLIYILGSIPRRVDIASLNKSLSPFTTIQYSTSPIMDNMSVDVLTLSAEGTGVNLQILKGQQNFLRWSRDFQIVVQVKGLWDVICEREPLYASPNASDFDSDEVDETPTTEESDKHTNLQSGPKIIDDTLVKPNKPKETEDDTTAKKSSKKSCTRKQRFSLSPYELANLLEKNDGKGKATETSSSAQTPTRTKLDLSHRLALYKFNLDQYERSRKRLHQAIL